MNLSDYIEDYAGRHCSGILRDADKALATKFRVSQRTVQSWRLLQRTPSPAAASIIVTATRGKVQLQDIYKRA